MKTDTCDAGGASLGQQSFDFCEYDADRASVFVEESGVGLYTTRNSWEHCRVRFTQKKIGAVEDRQSALLWVSIQDICNRWRIT